MYTRIILVLMSLLCHQQLAIAATPLTQMELEQGLQDRAVQHHTEKGIIVCRDPQIKFNEQDWLADESHRRGGHLREHMLVDTLVNKRLLGKQESFVDQLFPHQKVDSSGVTRYNVFNTTSKCGNVPALIIEAVFDKKHKLTRYRTRYYENGGQDPTIDSDWVEE